MREEDDSEGREKGMKRKRKRWIGRKREKENEGGKERICRWKTIDFVSPSIFVAFGEM